MFEAIRKFFRSSAGMGVAVVLLLAGLVTAYYTVRGAFGSEGAAMSADRMFMDATTNKPFRHELSESEPIPVKAPSGGRTGFPAEACYWTKDGKPKTEPTFVLINMWKGSKEPTFCPDCGRLVVGHNPPATPGTKPPPTKDEYEKSHKGPAGRG